MITKAQGVDRPTEADVQRTEPPRGSRAFAAAVCAALGGELGYLLLRGAPVPFSLALLAFAGAQGYIMRERSGVAWDQEPLTGPRRHGCEAATPATRSAA